MEDEEITAIREGRPLPMTSSYATPVAELPSRRCTLSEDCTQMQLGSRSTQRHCAFVGHRNETYKAHCLVRFDFEWLSTRIASVREVESILMKCYCALQRCRSAQQQSTSGRGRGRGVSRQISKCAALQEWED